MKNSLVSKLAIAAASLAAATALAETPAKWVDYVEATGSQWVDTEIAGRWNTKIEAKVEWMNVADSGFVGCGDWEKNQRFFLCYSISSKGEMGLSMGTNVFVQFSTGWNARFEKDRIYDYTAVFSETNSAGQSTGTVTVDGYGPWSMTYSALNNGRTLYVFANNKADGVVNGWSRTRCYGLKIYQGSIDGGDMDIVRDFRPCIDKDGRVGLYDTVSDTIFYSGSGTDLICDENCDVPDEFIEYVESQGPLANANGQKPAYIDTGITGKAETTVEFKETCLKTISDEYCLLGALGSTSNSRFYMWFHANGNTLGLGYENTYWRPSTTDPDTAAASQSASNVYKLNYGDTTHALVSFAAGLQTFSTIDDATGTTNLVSRKTIATSVDTKQNLYLFARNSNGTPNAFCASRLYGLKIWQGNDLVRDFRPCLKNGVAGLYDTVTSNIFYSLGTPLAFNNVRRRSDEPKEVVFVEYIESDGNNTLDTGVQARPGTRAKGEMMWTAENENGGGKMRESNHEEKRYLENTAAVFWRHKRAYLGAWNVRSSDSGRFHLLHESNAKLFSQYGSSGEIGLKNGGADVLAFVGVTNSFDVTFTNGTQTMEWNGNVAFSTNITGSLDTGNNLCLFSSSHWRWRSAARCYGLKIWQDGILVRDFKPCLVDGKGMLYDEVTKSIYRPSPDIPASRVGKIILSGEEKPVCYVDYVETDGNQFIDTGVIGKAATTAEFKETSLQKSSEEECFLGAFGNNGRFYLWYHASGYAAGLGYGATYWRPVTTDPTKAGAWDDTDLYPLRPGDTTHARVVFKEGSQTFTAINDETGDETLWTSLSLSGDFNSGRNLYLFAKNDGNRWTSNDKEQTLASSRFYFLKIWQGDSDGSNMRLVRNYRPVKLSNGLVVLWDFANDVPYLPQSKAAPYNYTTFPVVGPDGAEIAAPFTIVVR